jgi:hypothetical protein
MCGAHGDLLNLSPASFADETAGAHRGNGREERIRTSGPHVPNVVLYQAELLPDGVSIWRLREGEPMLERRL